MSDVHDGKAGEWLADCFGSASTAGDVEDLAQVLRDTHQAAARARDASLRAVIGRASEARERLMMEAQTDRGLQAPGQADFKAGKAEAYGWMAHLLGEVVTEPVEPDCARLRLALENVRVLASRMQRRGVADAEHLLRFCADAGVVPSILRSDEVDDGRGTLTDEQAGSVGERIVELARVAEAAAAPPAGVTITVDPMPSATVTAGTIWCDRCGGFHVPPECRAGAGPEGGLEVEWEVG